MCCFPQSNSQLTCLPTFPLHPMVSSFPPPTDVFTSQTKSQKKKKKGLRRMEKLGRGFRIHNGSPQLLHLQPLRRMFPCKHGIPRMSFECNEKTEAVTQNGWRRWPRRTEGAGFRKKGHCCCICGDPPRKKRRRKKGILEWNLKVRTHTE
ncbi:hypothetical protein DM02DRAFT_98684 [Periconia macrospinosa]|uniref:Uncharacterized protein n=1 Tax=Periconia macrospinosa TaxID=97972 RepID=A0A2V1E483_9PLEO|nr:hypothetical protein DM02DRAFT_98684 [Periconia macrospinosa]